MKMHFLLSTTLMLAFSLTTFSSAEDNRSIPANDTAKLNTFKKSIRRTKIMAKITPEHIILKDYNLSAKGLRLTQIWEK